MRIRLKRLTVAAVTLAAAALLALFGIRLWNEHVRERREEAILRIRMTDGKVKRDRDPPSPTWRACRPCAS
jgi:hypothetical protein